MTFKGVAVLGLVALACAVTGTRSFANDASDGKSGGFASPMPTEAKCTGWYNAIADVCDSAGD